LTIKENSVSPTLSQAQAHPTTSAASNEPARALNVVLVDEELPYPPTSGKRIRSLNLTLRLARRHRLTYLCHRHQDPAETLKARVFFLEHGIRTVVVDQPVPGKSGVSFYARLAANLLSPLPYTVSSHCSRALCQAIRQHAAQHKVDLWHCEWTPYAEAMRVLPAERWVVMAHNIESQIWQRYRDHERNPLRRWFIHRQLHKFLKFEKRIFSRAPAAVAVSADDAALAHWAFGAPQVDVVDNGVDTVLFQPPQAPRQAREVLFLGSLDWRPNLDAVGLLLAQIWPQVVAAEPEARLQIVGHNPPSWLRRRVAATPGVELHASVPDVRPFLARCSVLAVPLRIAGGSRLKILEALACETPVVSTRVGAEGLQLKAGEHLTVVEDNSRMAESLIEGLRSPEAARDQAQRGRQFVLQHHDWDRLAEKLEQVWLRCAAVPRL
jgi:glycosyltransferase involved in cell wall biosynthesis